MSTDTAGRCRQCFFYNKDTVHDKCTVCAELSFRESILCDLNNRNQQQEEKIPGLDLIKQGINKITGIKSS